MKLEQTDFTCPGSQNPFTSMNSSLIRGAPTNIERLAANWSSIRTTGCWAKIAPAVAVAEGCVASAKRLAATGLTATTLEVMLVRLPLVNWMVILVATL